MIAIFLITIERLRLDIGGGASLWYFADPKWLYDVRWKWVNEADVNDCASSYFNVSIRGVGVESLINDYLSLKIFYWTNQMIKFIERCCQK